MNAALLALGLDPQDGLIVIAVAFAAGVVMGIGATMAFSELPLQVARRGARWRTLLTIMVILGLAAIAVVLVSMVIGGTAVAPIIIFSGLGFLGGPLLFQSLERLPGSRIVGQIALIVADGAVISVADQYLL